LFVKEKNEGVFTFRIAATLTIFEPLKTNAFMKKIRTLLILLMGLQLITSCGEKAPKTVKKETKSSLVSIKNGIYTEYYPGRKAVKFQGPQNADGKRNGRWFFYAPNGTEQSMTEYTEGLRNGFTTVRYPDGTMRYTGEYLNDKPSGTWRFYKKDGSLEIEKEYPAQP
jgi:hypothetical protein